MSFPVLICDDSPLARKQMARSLPASLNADITFAVHGLDAMGILEKQSFKLMFLDLTMPELDGFETLEAMGKKRLHDACSGGIGGYSTESQRAGVSARSQSLHSKAHR